MASLLRKQSPRLLLLLGTGIRRTTSCNHRRPMSTALSHEILTAGEDRDDVKTGVLVHGLMGAGKNLRGLAKGLLRTVMERSSPTSSGMSFPTLSLSLLHPLAIIKNTVFYKE
jgi:hypothetical protein